MNLIVVADILNPPTELASFRDLTFWAKPSYENILLETQREFKDVYFKYLKQKSGILDFIADFVDAEDKEIGVRLDFELRFSPTILVNSITFNNYKNILSYLY